MWQNISSWWIWVKDIYLFIFLFFQLLCRFEIFSKYKVERKPLNLHFIALESGCKNHLTGSHKTEWHSVHQVSRLALAHSEPRTVFPTMFPGGKRCSSVPSTRSEGAARPHTAGSDWCDVNGSDTCRSQAGPLGMLHPLPRALPSVSTDWRGGSWAWSLSGLLGFVPGQTWAELFAPHKKPLSRWDCLLLHSTI